MNLQKKIIVYLFALFFVAGAFKAVADDFKLVPSVEVKEEYNDNIFFSDDNEEKDFITTISPVFRLSNRTERLKTALSARFDGIMYSDNNELNAIDQNYRGSLAYQLTTGIGISANAGYKKDSRRDRDIEVIGEDTATGLVQSESTRVRRTGELAFNSVLTEVTAMNCSYSFTRDDFDERDDNDIRMHVVNLGFTHNLTFIDELTVGRLNFGYARYDYLDGENVRPLLAIIDNSRIDSYSATIGFSRNITEVFTIFADVGGRYTKTKYETRYEYDHSNPLVQFLGLQDFSQKEDDSGNGMVANAAVSYDGELTSGSLKFYHDVRASSGRSGATERTSLGIDLSRRFTYKLRGSLSMEYYLNKADDGEFASSGIDEKTWRIRPRIRYDFTRNVFIEASYYFTKVKDDEDNTTQKRNQFFVKISMACPLFE